MKNRFDTCSVLHTWSAGSWSGTKKKLDINVFVIVTIIFSDFFPPESEMLIFSAH